MPDTSFALQLRERRAEIAKQMADLNKKAFDEDRGLSPEERTQFEKMNTDCDSLAQRVEDLEAVEEMQKDLDLPAGGNPDEFRLADGRTVDKRPADMDNVITQRDEEYAMRAWGLEAFGQRNEEFSRSADKVKESIRFGKEGGQLLRMRDSREYEDMRRQFRSDGINFRATTLQSKGTNAAGGFTVPTRLATTIEEALLYFGGMREAGTVFRTADGADFNIPTASDVGVATVLAENTAATVSDLNFAQVTFRAAKYSSGMVRTSIELMQDTAVDLIGYIGKALGTRIARGTNRDYTTGSTATTSPRGIIRDSFEGYAATTSSGDISLTTLVEMYHSVDREYRGPGSGWMMSDGIVKESRLVVDSNGQPLWGAGLRGGEPDTLLNRPVFVNNRLVASSTGAGAKLCLFGNLAKYMIRDALDIEIIRFNERYMDALNVGWLGIMRTDGKLLMASTANASKPVAHLKGTT